ncbi:MAG: DNA-directed RNA polymerase subunit beta' [Acetobacter sp.]|nr:DNA-directed RNA polymerase subunit beta' [Acetobacter sp.]MBQ5469410.1 DNA-directed RNA polymerase subunit beta' [Acetobacter sp.]MBQ5478711.1 DNA-directed RNA polymerase subunit beta' [Acetobacter sp.]
MSEVVRKIGQSVQAMTFDQIKIQIASPEQIRSWSYGEVKKPETINYRTFKPERDGLFCARIFGPVKDYECLCGKYKRMKFRNITCEKCGVEVTLSKVRRERMGHIQLANPVAHIWFLKSVPSRIGLMANLTLKDLEAVLYFESYLVLDPGISPLKQYDLLTEEQYLEAIEEYGEEGVEIGIGAEAIKTLLERIDCAAEKISLREELKKELEKEKPSQIRCKKLVKRLKLIESFIESGCRPEWMILDVLPVIPPDLRPLVPLDGGRFATSDLNDLYRRVINRNNRLKRLIELRAPDIIIRNEKCMLQESVDALFDNGRRGRAISGTNKRPLKSLSDMLKGKQGRFRQNLLGKRVDYSGRSVIVVGPELKLHQCGIPKKMALELFRPFVYARLEKYGYATTIKAAKRMVEREHPEVWDILEEVIREHPILLNRAPTLHRLGIQAFEPLLIEGKAIQLHPLVCTAFNADFDGDQMAVHVPLSIEAQLEARVLMMSTNNILHPANGNPVIVPSQDIVLGLYYMSLETLAFKATPNQNEYDVRKGTLLRVGAPVFGSISEVEHALSAGVLTLHDKICVRIEQISESGESIFERVITTPGRLLIAQVLPKHHAIPFSLINRQLTKKTILDVIDKVYRHCGQKKTVVFSDQLMTLGFRYAAKAGISFGKDDMIVPAKKKEFVARTTAEVKEFEQQYQDGLITSGERYNKVLDAWERCTNEVQAAMTKEISSQEIGKPINSVWMMSDSGARGSQAQMKQLAGMRGLMAKPSGEIIEQPIIASFKEGLSVLDYFTSTHGARKGLADTALKTAEAGYLTRRLVDVAQDSIVTEEDCGSNRGLMISAVTDGGEIVASLFDRILGRVAAADIIDPVTGVILVSRGKVIEEDAADRIENSSVENVFVRSVLTCNSHIGVCACCYGRDLARGTLVNIGEAVGVVAAQSIGEPGTQLTMRTFHTGGAAQHSVKRSMIEASCDGKVVIRNYNVVYDSQNTPIVIARNCEILVLDENGGRKMRSRVPYGARLLVTNGVTVIRGQKLVEWDPYMRPIIAEKAGRVRYLDLADSRTLVVRTNEETGLSEKVVEDYQKVDKGKDLNPRIQLIDADGHVIKLDNERDAYRLLPKTVLLVDEGQEVKVGDVIAGLPEISKTHDIVGGLPEVVRLFELIQDKEFGEAVIANMEGQVIAIAKNHIIVENDKTGEKQKYEISKNEYKRLAVQIGDFVERGDLLVDGEPRLQEILRAVGEEALFDHLVNRIQRVYRLQGVKINDKHIEVIVRQMLRKVEITESGDTMYLQGEIVDRVEFEVENAKRKSEGERPAQAVPVLQGISRASLQTQSFISAASFKETARVLTEAAIAGKVDKLRGLKENVIVGRLIPAGTGSVVNHFERSKDSIL